MKKIYLSAAILAFGGSLIAQAPTTQRAMFSTKKIKKDFKYLEIGVFEGNSFLFVTKELKPSISYAVDPWADSNEEISDNMLMLCHLFLINDLAILAQDRQPHQL